MTFVDEYHTARYGAPGQQRMEKRKLTPEDVRRNNQRHKTRVCHIRLEEYFEEEDYYLTLTYRPEDRPPDLQTAKKHFAKLIEKLKPVYRKAEVVLRWIRNIEKGTKGAWHIHMVIKAVPGERMERKIQELWDYGIVDSRPIEHREGGFRKLAEYLTKSEVNEKRLRESSYSTSRNMPLPEPEKKVVSYKKVGKPRVPKGFLLDRDSFVLDVNPVTGYLYSSYAYTRIGGMKHAEKNHTRGQTGGYQ